MPFSFVRRFRLLRLEAAGQLATLWASKQDRFGGSGGAGRSGSGGKASSSSSSSRGAAALRRGGSGGGGARGGNDDDDILVARRPFAERLAAGVVALRHGASGSRFGRARSKPTRGLLSLETDDDGDDGKSGKSGKKSGKGGKGGPVLRWRAGGVAFASKALARRVIARAGKGARLQVRLAWIGDPDLDVRLGMSGPGFAATGSPMHAAQCLTVLPVPPASLASFLPV